MKLTDDDLARLFTEHSPDLLRFFGRRVADPQAAVDLTSETFAEALASRKRFKGKSIDQGRPWLFGIAKNLLRRYYRDRRIEQSAMEKVRMERVVVDADDIAEIEAFADLADIRLAIERNWPAIPVEQQTAIRDRILLGLDYCEIAEKHGVTEPTVRSRVSRGLHSLRETIEAERTANSEGPA